MLTLELEAPRPIDEHGGGTEWGGPQRRWRWSARLWHGPDSGGGGVASRRWRGPDGGGGGAVRGAHGGGAGARHEPSGGGGGGRRFIDVDPMAVREAVGEDPTAVEVWRQSRSGRAQ
jgi:hypothetical protein